MKSILHLINELVREVAGPNGVKVVELLEGKENVSEFILSEQMEMNINELRTILYKLTEHNLLTSTRKKDKQKGWYVYYWTFNVIHARDLLIKHKEKQLNELKHKLTNKEVPKYICPHGCVSMGLEEAMEISFKCPECSSLLSLKEVKYNGDVIKKKINEVEGELELIRKAVVVEVAPKEKKVVVKPFVLKSFDNMNEILDSLRNGYTIAVIDIKPLKSKDIIELKRAISKIKKTADAIEGSIAGFGEHIIIVTPKFATIPL